MSKVTSKLQVTLPKALARQYQIKPGDDILWVASGDAIRVIVPRTESVAPDLESRLRLFDAATARQRVGQATRSARAGRKLKGRGWTREELYGRGRSR